MNKQEYNQTEQQIIDMLAPRVDVKPSADLKQRVLNAAATQQEAVKPRKVVRFGYWMRAAVSMAAVVALAVVLTFNTPATAARRYFSHAIAAAEGAKSMIMELMVRTEPEESVEFISPECAFVPATIKVIYDEPMVWSLEKQAGRKVVYMGATDEGNKVYQLIVGHDTGWSADYYNYISADLMAFLNPGELLGLEMRIAQERKERKYVKYEITEIGGWVNVKITGTAQGDFAGSDYMRNTSILESNTIREYSFDKQSGRLLKMRIDYVMPNKQQVTVVESSSILYDEPLSAEELVGEEFAQVEFFEADYQADATSPLANISADQAARIILDAMGDWDMSILETALYYFKGDALAKVEATYKGVKVLSVGKSFESGLYPGRFVECKVRLAGGQKENLVLALRNDNSARVWLLDGGI
ncbi:MAG: hypothetical protein IIW26_05430 [Tidjanibacter sp.]|nr:hypothetical protein [Tidjanibacter sp.]